MACPFFQRNQRSQSQPLLLSKNATEQKGYVSIRSENDLNYTSYLELDKVLTAQNPRSAFGKSAEVHDEHLFIVTHQAFELWFKQILHEINSIREIFSDSYLEERNMLTVISRLNRVVTIFKHISEQFVILETMTPLDFLDFRNYLEGGSGFQSVQFRLMEIRLGVKDSLRVAYNKQNYMDVFFGKENEILEKAQSEPSLLSLVNDWLERTPGLDERLFGFWNKFQFSVDAMLNEEGAIIKDEPDKEKREHLLWRHNKRVDDYKSLFEEQRHLAMLKRDERRFSYKALQGALMIFFYRDEPRLHLPFQMLHALTDLDTLFLKFRYNHSSMVQRMIGSKTGTGGSSGYQYLRSTCSDRYKIFLDLFNLPTFLVPRDRIPPLDVRTKRSLSVHDWNIGIEFTAPTHEDQSDSGIGAEQKSSSHFSNAGSFSELEKLTIHEDVVGEGDETPV